MTNNKKEDGSAKEEETNWFMIYSLGSEARWHTNPDSQNVPLAVSMLQRITVKVAGCVKDQRNHTLPLGASVSDAISAAKGFGKKPYPSAGVITVRSRRKRDGLYYRRRRFDIQATDMRSVVLRDRDLIVVQYDVDG